MRLISKFLSYSVVAFILFVAYSYATLPDVKKMGTCFTTSMNKVRLCPKSDSYVRLSQVSPNIKNAVVISEDAAFYSHHGFDFDEMENSFKTNLERGAFARGGSTISQQLAKNLFLYKEKSITRKLKELILTKKIEERYSKSTILEKYLNVIELGKNVYGIRAGMQFYFQKNPDQATPLEGAFIAFLLPNPEKYSVSFKRKELTPFARKRIKDILYKMSFYKKISTDEYQESLAQLESLFKPIPQMEDEPSQQEMDSEIYDLTQSEELRVKQQESIEKLQEEDSTESADQP